MAQVRDVVDEVAVGERIADGHQGDGSVPFGSGVEERRLIRNVGVTACARVQREQIDRQVMTVDAA